MTEPAITTADIPLDRLEPDPDNPRRGATDTADLEASIASHGLLENLVVLATGGPAYRVAAGNRRLAAQRARAARREIPPDAPIPCRVLPAGASPTEISLAENLVRAAMLPADEYLAFRTLLDDGLDVATVARRFGTTEHNVERRMRLGNVHPEIFDAYRAGNISLDTLQAFAVTPDQAVQHDIWSRLARPGEGDYPTEAHVRTLFAEGRVPAASPVARFVGDDAFTAAGGTISLDLFHPANAWYDQADLLNRLAAGKLSDRADALRREEPGWRWIRTATQSDWHSRNRYGHAPATHATPDADHRERRRRIRDARDALPPDAADAHRRLDADDARLDAELAARSTWDPDLQALSGCLVTIGADGGAAVHRGLVDPADISAMERLLRARQEAPARPPPAAGDADPGDPEHGPDDPPAGPESRDTPGNGAAHPAWRPPAVTPAPEPARQAGYAAALADELRVLRGNLAKAFLARTPAVALDLFVFDLAVRVLLGGHDRFTDRPVPEDIFSLQPVPTATVPASRTGDPDFARRNVGATMIADRSHLDLAWADGPGGEPSAQADAFRRFRTLPDPAKHAILAAAVAPLLVNQLATDPARAPATETAVDLLGIDFAGLLTFDAELFWSRLRKDVILEILPGILGRDWVERHGHQPKNALLAAVEAELGRPGAPPWAPPGFPAAVPAADD